MLCQKQIRKTINKAEYIPIPSTIATVSIARIKTTIKGAPAPTPGEETPTPGGTSASTSTPLFHSRHIVSLWVDLRSRSLLIPRRVTHMKLVGLPRILNDELLAPAALQCLCCILQLSICKYCTGCTCLQQSKATEQMSADPFPHSEPKSSNSLHNISPCTSFCRQSWQLHYHIAISEQAKTCMFV